MTPYFSRLAQRSGGSPQGVGRSRARAADPRVATATESGYREQEDTVSVDPAPTAVEAVQFAQAGSTQPVPNAPATAHAAETHAETHAAADVAATRTTPVTRAASAANGHDDVRRIDPYRNDPDDDIVDDFAAHETLRTTTASEPWTPPRAESPTRARVLADGFVEAGADPVATPGPREDDAREAHQRIEATPQTQSRMLPRAGVRARAVDALGETSRVRGEDFAATEETLREHVRADAPASARPWPQRDAREGADAVRAQAPQAASPPTHTPRAVQSLHVQIGRVELEVIAPPPKAPPAPPPQISAAPVAPPSRKSGFNPHRHYLRGR